MGKSNSLSDEGSWSDSEDSKTGEEPGDFKQKGPWTLDELVVRTNVDPLLSSRSLVLCSDGLPKHGGYDLKRILV